MINEAMMSVVMSFMMSEITETERECLALNTYHEARDQSKLGQIGVAQVVLNRVDDARYPGTICGVVKQQGFHDPIDTPVKLHACQFSWYCDGKPDDPSDSLAYDTAMRQSAHAYYLHHIEYDLTEGSTHYHSDKVLPAWVDDMTHITNIDNHHFYRWD